MHGNVYEWFADGPRGYSADPQVDPVGPSTEEGDEPALRVVRGGSWCVYAEWARSADRDAYRPGFGDLDLGFRLSLRSIEPGPKRPGGPTSNDRRPPGDRAGRFRRE